MSILNAQLSEVVTLTVGLTVTSPLIYSSHRGLVITGIYHFSPLHIKGFDLNNDGIKCQKSRFAECPRLSE